MSFVWVNDECVKDSVDDYYLVLLNNRDEDYDRPTSSASWCGDILCCMFYSRIKLKKRNLKKFYSL